MDYRAGVIASCWIAVGIIASVYMLVFADRLGDILFGVFLPVGLLVLVAFVVTMAVVNMQPEKK